MHSRVLMLTTRQAGKSTTTAALALRTALLAGATVLLVSPTLRQSGELFRKVTRFYAALGRPVGSSSETATQLSLGNGGRIISLPGSESTIRGYSAGLVIVDEASRVSDELRFALSPMLATTGGRLIALTTPFGRRGWFFEAWEKEPEWEKVRVTAGQCPRIAAEFLAAERKAMGPRWFAQEYECEFRDAVDAVFFADDIDAAIDPHMRPLFPGVAS